MPESWISHRNFTTLVLAAIKGLPQQFRDRLENVAIEIEEEPTAEALLALGIEPGDPEELFGLYVGRSIQGRSFFDPGGQLPDRVYIYRGPILRACLTKEEAIREIQATVVHEIGHHFGLSDDDMPL
jgi:predicted Zn-dependent protease with MMP-like domain